MTFWLTFLGTVLRRYLKWILPVMLLDGCFNRDPYVKIDERFSIAAICGSCPMSLIQRDPKWQERSDEVERLPKPEREKAWDELMETASWQIHDLTECQLSEKVIIGHSSDEGFFMADRGTGRRFIFKSRTGRDVALKNNFGLDAQDESFHKPTQLMWMRGRVFWPWVELYYLVCLLIIPWRTFIHQRRADKQFYELPQSP